MMIVRRLVLVGSLVFAAALATACGDGSQNATELDRVPGAVEPGDANRLPTDIQELKVAVDGGKFDHSRYDMQTGAVQMMVSTIGGPYKLTIEMLVQSQKLPAGTVTKIGFTAPDPGEYTMTITEGGDGTATLNVRPPGGR